MFEIIIKHVADSTFHQLGYNSFFVIQTSNHFSFFLSSSTYRLWRSVRMSWEHNWTIHCWNGNRHLRLKTLAQFKESSGSRHAANTSGRNPPGCDEDSVIDPNTWAAPYSTLSSRIHYYPPFLLVPGFDIHDPTRLPFSFSVHDNHRGLSVKVSEARRSLQISSWKKKA